jgi:hypothetical protein
MRDKWLGERCKGKVEGREYSKLTEAMEIISFNLTLFIK